MEVIENFCDKLNLSVDDLFELKIENYKTCIKTFSDLIAILIDLDKRGLSIKGNTTYTAVWEEDKDNNEIADNKEEKYTVTYNDGVKDEEIFKDDVHEDLLKGTKTPAFRLDDVNLDTKGNPYRENYVFAGWKDYKDTVEGNVIYTALWAVDKDNDGIADK